jgi:hypothetical protein
MFLGLEAKEQRSTKQSRSESMGPITPLHDFKLHFKTFDFLLYLIIK